MRATGLTALFFASVSFIQIPLAAQVPPGTGAGGAAAFNDENFKIVLEKLSPHQTPGCAGPASPCPSSPSPASIVTKLAGWATELPGTKWIAPHPDQSHGLRRGSYAGSVTYETQFLATQALTLNARVLADDNVVVSLNGTVVFSSTGAQHLVAAMFKLTGFVSGINTVTFVVTKEGGGPTGLDVAFSDAGAPPSGPALALHHPAYPNAMTFYPAAAGETSAQTLTVVNNGDATAVFAAIGPPAGNFSIDPNSQGCAASLEPGSLCTFKVIFNPGTAMPASQTGTLKIALQGAANPSTYTVNLSGTTGATAVSGDPHLTFSPASLEFPTTPPNTVPAPEQFVIITNDGKATSDGKPAAAAVFSDIYIPSNFTIDWHPSTALDPVTLQPLRQACIERYDSGPGLAAGASCILGIKFTPTSTAPPVIDPQSPASPPGLKMAIDLFCPAPLTCQGTFYILPLSGTAGDGPILTFSPNPLVFPNTTAAGSASPAINVTVTNIGTADGKFSNLPASTTFKVAGFGCVNPSQVIAQKTGTCIIPFTFNPPATAAAGTILTEDLNVFLGPPETRFPLSASGKVGVANGPAVTVTPNPVNFSANPAKEEYDIESFTITNTGNAPLIITSYTPPKSSTFEYVTTCATTILPKESCKQDLLFRPQSIGAREPIIGTLRDAIILNTNAAPPLQTVSLIAVGLAPVVSLDKTTLNLLGGAGRPGPSQSIILTNTGNADLHITNVTVNSDVNGFNKTNDSCLGQTIPYPNGKCTLQFNFNPNGIPGPWQTTVTITDDAIGRTQFITLIGGFSGPAISVTPNDARITSGNPIEITLTPERNKQVITLTNVGGVDITIKSINVRALGNGFFTGDLTSCFSQALQARPFGQLGGQCTFTINFNGAPKPDVVNYIDIVTDPAISGFYIALNWTTSPSATSPGDFPFVAAWVSPNEGSGSDPVSTGSGQYYVKKTDLSLAGPMQLTFARYYAAALSAGGFKSALGANWMHNFEVQAAVSSSKASVLLFRGEIVKFTNANGAWQLASPNAVVYQFAPSGSNYQMMDPQTARIYTFNSTGALIQVADRNGNAITITQGPDGPVTAADGFGRTLSFTYSNSQLTRVQDQTGRSVSYSYTDRLLTTAANVMNQPETYSYTSTGTLTGLMTKTTLPMGEATIDQTFDSSGRVISQADAGNNITQISYDGSGTATMTDPLGTVSRQTNANLANLTQVTDGAGNSAAVTYDSSQRRASVTDKLGNSNTYTYHAPTGYIASRTDARGNTITATYSAQAQVPFTFYNMTGIQDADGGKASYTYDAAGNQLTETSPAGAVARHTYDSHGFRATETAANGAVTTYAYNPDATVASITDGLGNKTAYAYDSLKRTSAVTDANGGTTKVTYDAAGRWLSKTSAVGGVNATAYDADGRVVSRTNPYGGIQSFSYNPTGTLAGFKDPLGNTQTYGYDALNRLVSRSNPTGQSLAVTYDATGIPTAIADNAGPRAAYTSDAEGNLASYADNLGRTWKFKSDPQGRVVGVTSPLGNTYSSTYDQRGALTSVTNPLGQSRVFAIDAAGRVSGTTWGGLSTSFQRDASGLVTGLTDPNGNTWNIAYDALQHPTKYTDPLGAAAAFTYTKGRLTHVALPAGSIDLSYDAAGKVTKRQYSDGTSQSFTFDANSSMTAADGVDITRDAKGQPTRMNGIAVDRDAAGRLAALTYAPGKTLAYSYDASGRLATIADWVGGQTTFAYDAAGELISLTHPNGIQTTYGYDADGRSNQIAVGALASINLTLDAGGRPISSDRQLPASPSLTSGAQSFSYDAAGQMKDAEYDAVGRAVSQNGRKYTWDVGSHLLAFDDGSSSAALTYDARGEMSSFTQGGVSRNLVFNYVHALPALSIVRQGGADLRYYVYTPAGTLLYSLEAGDNSRKFYHFDETGNTAFLTDDTGAVTDTYAITPYGELADHTGPTDNPFTYQGMYGVIQEAPGLYYMRGRHYDATSARFLSRDSRLSGDPLAAGLYVYANGDPLLFNDPFGAASGQTLKGCAISLLISANLHEFVTCLQTVDDVVNKIIARYGFDGIALVAQLNAIAAYDAWGTANKGLASTSLDDNPTNAERLLSDLPADPLPADPPPPAPDPPVQSLTCLAPAGGMAAIARALERFNASLSFADPLLATQGLSAAKLANMSTADQLNSLSGINADLPVIVP